MIGRRQHTQTQTIPAGSSYTFTVDLPGIVHRIKVYPTDGICSATDPALRIQAEGELLNSGASVPLAAQGIKLDHSAGDLSTGANAPWVIPFERRPLTLDKDYPITIWVTGSDCVVTLEGDALEG